MDLDSSAVRRRVAELGKPQISPTVQVLRPPVVPAPAEEESKGETQRYRLRGRWLKLAHAPPHLCTL